MLQNLELLNDFDTDGSVLIGAYDGKKRVIGKISRKYLDDLSDKVKSDPDRRYLVDENFEFFAEKFQNEYEFERCNEVKQFDSIVWMFEIV